jgi:N-dimethylarginine dimethylaminohydrolase
MTIAFPAGADHSPIPTQAATVTALPTVRTARTRHYLMCRPTYFTVEYAINPWMDPDVEVDLALAIRQWEGLRDTYRALGHEVSLIHPVPGLPDMVFAANGALVVDGKVFGASFKNAERQPEGPAYRDWFADADFEVIGRSGAVNEGEGDFLALGDFILAGTGFRTDHRAHMDAQEFFGKPVLTMVLVDPRFYHLDTALAVLGDNDIAYYPKAFSPGSQAVLARLFPDAIRADDNDAATFGLNSVSDGRHVVVPSESVNLIARLRERGYEPVPVDLSEFKKAGGGPKCCTLEIRP